MQYVFLFYFLLLKPTAIFFPAKTSISIKLSFSSPFLPTHFQNTLEY